MLPLQGLARGEEVDQASANGTKIDRYGSLMLRVETHLQREFANFETAFVETDVHPGPLDNVEAIVAISNHM